MRIIGLILSFFLSFTLMGQNSRNDAIRLYHKDNPANTIYKTNPLSIIYGPILYTAEYKLFIEQRVAAKQGIQLGFSYLGKNSMLRVMEQADTLMQQNNMKYTVNGFRIQLAYRFYLSKKFPKGFYISPHFSYSKAKIKIKTNGVINHNYYALAVYSNYNLLVGYQVHGGRVVFDFFTGLGFKNNNWSEFYRNKHTPMDESNMYLLPEPIKISLGINVGFAF
jgi:hypothetical protein